jgi:hypothetical protein
MSHAHARGGRLSPPQQLAGERVSRLWHSNCCVHDMATKRSKRTRQTHPGTQRQAKTKKRPTRYGKAAAKKVGRALHEAKEGSLRSGRSKKKVRSRKQAIAIGLSEARQRGAKVPPKPR